MQHRNAIEDLFYIKEPLPADAQKKLVELAKAGSREAQDELVSTNLRFVRMFASRYGKSDEYEISELVSEGVAGLITAIYKFDSTKEDVAFMSYAVWWIKNGMSRFVRNKTKLIRVPENRNDIEFILFSFDAQSVLEDGVSTTFDELIEQRTFEDPSSVIGEDEIRRNIETLLNEIPPEEATVIKCRFGLDGEVMSYDEIESITKIRKGRLKDLCERGLRRVRKNITFSPNREDLLQYIQTE